MLSKNSRIGLFVLTSLTTAFMLLHADAARAGQRENSLKDGAWAIQFGIDDDFRLKAFEGGVISLKRHLSAVSAIRAGIGFGAMNETTDRFASDADSDSYDMDISLVYQRYFRRGDRVNVYWGLGPFGNVSRRSNIYPALNSYRRLVKKSRGGGLLGLVGGEVFITEEISIHAEYRGSGGYSWDYYYQKMTEHVTTKYHDERWSVNVGGAVLFGLSAYF